ncbi:MAG TPA: DEAD/DEAH box helicase, partial [Chloroflexia bacterium]
VVACPGRLIDHISESTIALARVETLVLDEADRMFDMGFLPDIRRILKHLPAERQTLLFSATMPADIRRLAQEVLRNPITVQVGTMEPVKAVSHALYPVATHLKTPLLLALLRQTDTESVLVFTRTKYKAKRLGEQLVNAGFRGASLQGNLGQNRRQAALDGFRDGTHQILVATDIAARGIDVSQISHVINYDMPDTVEAYTHRIGRTGRAAKTGDAFTFVTDEDQDMVRAIERALGGAVPRHKLPGFDYSVPAPVRDTEFARPPRVPQPRRAKPAPAPAPAATPVPATPAPARRPAASPAPAPAPKRARPARAPRPGNAPGAPASRAHRHATG